MQANSEQCFSYYSKHFICVGVFAYKNTFILFKETCAEMLTQCLSPGWWDFIFF